MLNSAGFAVGVVVVLVLRAVFVPLLAAFFGSVVGYAFPETTQAFLQYIKFEDVSFWQLMLLVGTFSMIWGLGSPAAIKASNGLAPSTNKGK